MAVAPQTCDIEADCIPAVVKEVLEQTLEKCSAVRHINYLSTAMVSLHVRKRV